MFSDLFLRFPFDRILTKLETVFICPNRMQCLIYIFEHWVSPLLDFMIHMSLVYERMHFVVVAMFAFLLSYTQQRISMFLNELLNYLNHLSFHTHLTPYPCCLNNMWGDATVLQVVKACYTSSSFSMWAESDECRTNSLGRLVSHVDDSRLLQTSFQHNFLHFSRRQWMVQIANPDLAII